MGDVSMHEYCVRDEMDMVVWDKQPNLVLGQAIQLLGVEDRHCARL
jgi:hypothetical protein